MVEREGSVYSSAGPETRMTVFDGMQPTEEETFAQIQKLVDQVLIRKPVSIVIYAEFKEGEGGIVAGAVGSPLTLANLMRLGKLQVEDMMSRGLQAGENG